VEPVRLLESMVPDPDSSIGRAVAARQPVIAKAHAKRRPAATRRDGACLRLQRLFRFVAALFFLSRLQTLNAFKRARGGGDGAGHVGPAAGEVRVCSAPCSPGSIIKFAHGLQSMVLSPLLHPHVLLRQNGTRVFVARRNALKSMPAEDHGWLFVHAVSGMPHSSDAHNVISMRASNLKDGSARGSWTNYLSAADELASGKGQHRFAKPCPHMHAATFTLVPGLFNASHISLRSSCPSSKPCESRYLTLPADGNAAQQEFDAPRLESSPDPASATWTVHPWPAATKAEDEYVSIERLLWGAASRRPETKCALQAVWAAPPAPPPLVEVCFNRCSHRGECVRGICLCEAGFFGWDCGSGSGSGFIYIYDLPAELGLNSFISGMGSDPIYQAEAVFLSRIMADWKVRTLAPEQARLFYVPTFFYYEYNNVALADTHLETLRRHLKYWGGRPNGEDHIFFLTGDRGACSLPSGPIHVTHFGLQVPLKFYGAEDQWVVDASADERAEDSAPCWSSHDIVVPPYLRGTPDEPLDLAAPTNFSYELSFSGAIWGGGINAALTDNVTAEPRTWPGDQVYSQQVRQLVYIHHSNRPRFMIKQGWMSNDVLRESRFCLAPSGFGWGMRLARLMLMGCVPLIIQPRTQLPFEDLLPYDTFSLRLENTEIPNLHHILAGVTPERHARMRREVERYRKAFSYNGGGTAYGLLIRSLRQRARAMLAQ